MMGFNCAIVGLPNVGKSTLFNALTRAHVDAQNYPFCTIDPNYGIVSVPDSRLTALAALVNPQKVIPTTIEFVDIAGLVKGAAQGEGLGNQFLSHIRETDAIAHVVRCFENDDVIHVSGKISPKDDIEIIHTELLLADLETVTKALHRSSKASKSGDKDRINERNVLEGLVKHIESGKSARIFPINDLEIEFFKTLHLLTAKPVLFVANVAENGFTHNPHLDLVKQIATAEQASAMAISAAIESELVELDEMEQCLYLKEIGLEEPGLNRLIRAGYDLLTLQTFFTAGPKEVRAWTIRKGASAPEAAGRIHTDFEKGFIRAEVIAYADFIQHKGEHGAKEAGLWRLEGKDYIMQDGDVVHFRFNV